MKKYLYTVLYVDKYKYLQSFDIEAANWQDIKTQIDTKLKDDVDYIVSVRYGGELCVY